MDLRTIGVVGTGASGAGIAQICVQSGLSTLLADESDATLSQAEDAVLRGLHRAEQPAAFSLLRKTTDMRSLADCDFIIETTEQELGPRKTLFRKLDSLAGPECVLATNTSAVPVARLANSVENPRRVVGLHFFHPPAIARLVEVIRSEFTSEEAVAKISELAESLGKTAVRSADTPGFIVNRVSRPYFLAAMRLLESGKAGPKAVDEALRSAGFPMGPLELADGLGLEQDFALSTEIHQLLGEPERLKPCALEEKLLSHGCRGRRNSRGFYSYGENPPGTENPLVRELSPAAGQSLSADELRRRVLQAVAEEARLALQENVASPRDIDLALRLCLGWPEGWNK